jgi:hypothetical protein
MEEVIARLRGDAEKLRTDQHNTAYRWIGGDSWRYKGEIATDIEALIKAYEAK